MLKVSLIYPKYEVDESNGHSKKNMGVLFISLIISWVGIHFSELI
jgi:hypothetical protein